MGPFYLAAALLIAIAALASAPPARAQDAATETTPPVSVGAGAPALAPCGGVATAADPSAYASGRLDCPPARNRASWSPNQACASPYRGYSGLLYTDHTPFHAPGGEAYSYAGYGSSYSPYVTSTGAGLPTRSASAESRAVSTSPATCTSPIDSPATSASLPTRVVRPDLGSLALPATTDIQRGTDLREPNIWLIQTREGPVVQRVGPDGRRAFALAPPSAGNGATIWRPWGDPDRPAVDYAWQNFAIWWTDQGRAWPPS